MIFEIDTENKTVIFKSECKVNELYDLIVEYQLQNFTIVFDKVKPMITNPISPLVIGYRDGYTSNPIYTTPTTCTFKGTGINTSASNPL